MAINYQDPRFQKLLIRKAAMSPYGGTRNTDKETAAWAENQTRSGLEAAQALMTQRMNQARIEQMGFERGMGEKRLGLEQGYFGLRERGMGLQERGLGIQERGLGIQEQELGLRSAFQGLSERQGSWKNRQFMRDLADKQSNLDLSTWLGLGQAAWGGYEGHRRAELLAEDRLRQKKMDTMLEQFYNRGRD